MEELNSVNPYLPTDAMMAEAALKKEKLDKKPTPSPKSELFDGDMFRKMLPPEMLAEKRFVRFFLKPKPEGGTAKIPLGNHSDPSTWSTFDDAVAALENDQQGIGFNFLGGEIHGLDIDHARNPKTGIICNEAMLLLSRFQSWSEFSVSGQGIHVLFKGNVRGKQLTETCLQYWNPKNAPRFFALTCNMVGEAFRELKDVGDDFNYIFATAKHISAKIREELKTVDHEQWLALPKERGPVELVTREKSKTKARKVAPGFDVKDFLAFYGLGIDNECDNELGHCVRLTTCPLKGEAHVGHNSTTCNFIYPCKDGGLAYHCQSTGCVEYGIKEVLEALVKEKGTYPQPIYEAKQREQSRIITFEDVSPEHIEEMHWLWENYLPKNQLIHSVGASSQGKSPVWRDLIARMTSGREWPNGQASDGPCTVVVMANEDDWPTVVNPHLKFAGADFKYIKRVKAASIKDGSAAEVNFAFDQDIEALDKAIRERGDVGAVVCDPVTNYLGRLKMNREEEMRSILMPLAQLAQSNKVSVNTIGHINKSKDVEMLDKVMGARAFMGVARQALFFSNDENDESEFAHVMGFGRKTTTPGLKYRTVQQVLDHNGKLLKVVAVEWGGESRQDMESAVTSPLKQADKSDAKTVRQIINTALRNGQKPSEHIVDLLKENGIDPKFNWQRVARKFAESGKGGVEKKGEKFFWWLPTNQTEFDK